MYKRFVTILLLLATISCYSATIHGKITNANTGEELVGATVYVSEIKKGFVSGLDGTFVIANLPTGTYTFICKYLGCIQEEKKINIQAEKDQYTLDFGLKSNSILLNEVTISAHKDLSSEISARNSEKTSNNIINVVSSKAIELSPDLNVANVLQRMSGITIERSNSGDGQYAILRGMDKRYNYTSVNGIKIPSTNAKYRYVPLDIFPSSLVERIEVTKALTPNMEGDAVGGVVNMLMKQAPDKWLINFNIATGYNSIFFEHDFMGFNAHAINYKSPYELKGENYVATPKDFSKENLNLKKYSPLPNITTDISVGNRFFHKKLGVILAASFTNKYKGSTSDLYGTDNDITNLPEITGKSKRTISEKTTQLGIHNKIDYQFNKKHKIVLYNAFMNFTTAQTRESESASFDNSASALSSYSLRYRLNNQQLISSVLQGEHILTNNLLFQWSGVFGLAQNKTPDQVNLSLFNEIQNNQKLPLTVSNGGSTRTWEHNTDEDFAGYVNLTYHSKNTSFPFELSTGGLYRDKRRTSFYNVYTFFAVLNTDYKSIQGRDWNNFSDIMWKNSVDLDNTHALNFTASEDILAGYGQFKIQLHKLQIVGGMRIENTDQGYTLKYTKGDVPPIGNQTYIDLLPSLHLKFTPFEKNNIRASYYRSINRPGFLEIVPYKNEAGEDYKEKGNRDIKHTVADNYDLRYELYPKPLDQFMVGLFYKHIQDPIEYGFVTDGSKGIIYTTPLNLGVAKNYGLEVDFIKYIRLFGIKANYTYTNSKITSWKKYRVQKENGWQLDSLQQTRPLFGQSAHVANLTILFKDTKSGWDAQLSGSYTGERIFYISRFLDDDQWQKGSVQADASIEKNTKNGLSFFVKANNLFNSPLEVFIKKKNPINASKINQNDYGNTTPVRKDYYMQSFLLGVRYKLK